jgi:hypothetical protein
MIERISYLKIILQNKFIFLYLKKKFLITNHTDQYPNMFMNSHIRRECTSAPGKMRKREKALGCVILKKIKSSLKGTREKT